MPLRVVVVGDDKRDPLRAIAEDYLKRAGRKLSPELICVKEGKRKKGADDVAIRNAEGTALLDASNGCLRVAMDAGGREHSSELFASSLEKWIGQGRPVAFLIGGATGLSDDVKEKADHLFSLSQMTLPHRLALTVLCEQLYRATQIWQGGPYHK